VRLKEGIPWLMQP